MRETARWRWALYLAAGLCCSVPWRTSSGQVVLLEVIGTTPAFGFAITAIGDVDYDGTTDLLVGAPEYNAGNAPLAGLARVYSGWSGALLLEWQGVQQSAWQGVRSGWRGDVDGDGLPEAMFFAALPQSGLHVMSTGTAGFLQMFPGWVGRGVGDHNGDGIEEVVTGDANWSVGGGTANGKVAFYDGATATEMFSVTASPLAMFGWRVDTLGDVNADGVTDIVASAYQAGILGAVFVISGTDGSQLLSIPGLPDAQFGESVAGPGDLDGDGIGDVAVGAPAAGLVRAHDGVSGGMIRFWLGMAPAPELGRSLSRVGDVDLDGRADLLAGAASTSTTNLVGGVAVFSGRTGETLFWLVQGPPGAPGYQFGRAVAEVGDFNGDGFSDFAAGAPYSPVLNGPRSVRVFSGAPVGSAPFGGACPSPGGWQPTIGAARPVVAGTAGAFLRIHLSGVPPGELGLLLVGLSNSSWVGIPLPLDLGFLGLPGCSLLVSPDFVVPVVATGGGPLSGFASVPGTIPLNSSTLGGSVYFQWLVVSPGSSGAVTRALSFLIQ